MLYYGKRRMGGGRRFERRGTSLSGETDSHGGTVPAGCGERSSRAHFFYVFSLPAVMPMLKEGRLRAVAVATGKRAVALPDIPTTAESGFPQYQSDSWFGIVAPAGVPKRTIDKLNADIAKVLRDADTRERFQKQGAEPSFGSPEHFQKLQSAEYARLAKLIKDIGMKPL
jgi:tripartite-type tricarboxylate transporter receptor subunit TctC